MSISLSLYDIFSITVPGLIYLFAINELLRAFSKPYVDILQISTSGQILLLVLAAFVLGHLFNPFTYDRWYRLFVKTYEDKMVLERINSRFPELKLKFKPTDSEILFAVIQSRNKGLADRIETHRANAIMMRNISFGLFLIGLVELTYFIMSNYAISFLATTILCFIFSRVAIGSARRFYEWFYRDVFRISSVYGNTCQAVIKQFRTEVVLRS